MLATVWNVWKFAVFVTGLGNGCREEVAVWLEYKADINAEGKNGETPLALVSGNRFQKDLAEMLRRGRGA